MAGYYTFQIANNKDTEQTAWMHRLVCAFVVCKPQRQIFSRRGPYMHYIIHLSPKFEYGFCQMYANQDGHQDGCCLSLRICGHYNSVIYHLIAFKFHICITLINLFDKSKCGYYPMYPTKKRCPLSICTCGHNNNLQWTLLSLFILGHYGEP